MPADFAQLLELIRANGEMAYAFLFSYAAANSLLLVLFAGYAAHLGALDWSKVFLVAWAGSFAGDGIRFWIGRRFGPGWLKRFPRLERAVIALTRPIDRHYRWILMVHRYPHGIRTAASLACGLSCLPGATFLAINAVSAAVWAALLVATGYGFGHLSEKVLSDAASALGFAALLAFLGLFWLLGRKLDDAIKPQ